MCNFADKITKPKKEYYMHYSLFDYQFVIYNQIINEFLLSPVAENAAGFRV